MQMNKTLKVILNSDVYDYLNKNQLLDKYLRGFQNVNFNTSNQQQDDNDLNREEGKLNIEYKINYNNIDNNDNIDDDLNCKEDFFKEDNFINELRLCNGYSK